MVKVAVYCRLSEEDRNKRTESEDSGSIQNQKAMLREYAEERGWEIYEVYCDEDYAGADRNRPAFRRLLSDAEARKFNVILCKTQSRFTRELELVERYIHGLFPLWGIRFISIVDNADTSVKGNKKSRQINGLVNEWYLEDLSENIRSVLTNRRKNGYHIGAFALYGYRKDPNRKGGLLIDEESAAVVREVYRLFDAGYGKTAIARILNERGIPNPSEYKRQKGITYRTPTGPCGRIWKYSTVSSILTNEMYVGTMVQGKYGSVSYKTKQNRPRPKEEWYVVEGTHEAIVARDLWDRVQERMREHSKPFSKEGEVGIFSGKARCAGCGYALRTTKSRGVRYLMCPNHHVSKTACSGAFLSEEKLEERVRSELNRLTEKYLDRKALLREISLTCRSEEARETLRKTLLTYETKREDYDRTLRTLYLDRGKEVISEAEFIRLSEDFRAEATRIDALILDCRERLLAIEAEDAEERQEGMIDRYVAPDRLTRALMDRMIDRIEVGMRIPGTRTVPITIYWSF